MMKKYIGQPKMINRVNKDLIKDIISQNGPISKPQIAKITQLSLPTVNKIVESMVAEGLFKVNSIGSFGVGRKPILYEINGDIGYIIALYIENEYSNGYIKGALVDLMGNVVYKENYRSNYELNRKNKKSMFSIIDSLIQKVKDTDTIRAISIGIPGVMDDEGEIYRIPNILQWQGVNMKRIIEEEYKIPTHVENDVNLASVGIYYKYFLNKNENIIYIYFGEGIGAGIIVKGKLFKGKNNFAGEISHLIVNTPKEGDLIKYKDEGMFGHECLSLINAITKDDKIRSLLESDSENEAILKDKNVKLLIKIISFALINMVPLINPEIVAIRGTVFSKSILEEIEKCISNYIGRKNCPKLFLQEDGEIGLEGTIRLSLSHSISNYSFINDKGV